jgi:hypothetical protein
MEAGAFMPGPEVLARIRADIEAYEAGRASALRRVKWRVPIFLGALLAFMAVVALFFNAFADPNEQWLSTPHVFLYLCCCVASIFLYLRAMKPADDLRQSLRDRILPVVFSFVEDVRYQHGVKPDSFDRLPREALAPYMQRRFDDFIRGRYDGFPIELYEADLWEGSGASKKTAFRGVVVAFEPAAPFPGVLVATRRAGPVAGFLRGIFGHRLVDVQSGDADLDGVYEFRTDKPDMALPLVRGRLAKTLKWLGETWPKEPARIALTASDGFMLLPQAKNYFELPPISKPLDYKAHVEPMIADIAALLAAASLVRKAGGNDEEEAPAAV